MQSSFSFQPRTFLELQHLGFRNIQPAPQLRPWIQGYWQIDRTNMSEGGIREKVYPDGGSSLSFILNGDGIRFSASPTTTVSDFPGDSSLFGIRFYPGGAYRLLGFSFGDIPSGKIFHGGLNLPGLEALFEQMQMTGPDSVPGLAENWLLERAGAVNLSAGLIQRFWPRLASGANIGQALANTGISRRNLERRFKREVGLSPGYLQQLLRLKRARQLIKTGWDMSLTDIAHSCGYFDQAHFNHQFDALTGESPGHYRRRQLDRLRKKQLVLL